MNNDKITQPQDKYRLLRLADFIEMQIPLRYEIEMIQDNIIIKELNLAPVIYKRTVAGIYPRDPKGYDIIFILDMPFDLSTIINQFDRIYPQPEQLN